MRKPIASAGTLALRVPRSSVASQAEFRSSDAGPSSTTCAPESKVISAKPRANSSRWPLRRKLPSRAEGAPLAHWHSFEPVIRATYSSGCSPAVAGPRIGCWEKIQSAKTTHAAAARKPSHDPTPSLTIFDGETASSASTCISLA